MRRKPEKERGQKTVYSAFWPAERPHAWALTENQILEVLLKP